MNFTKFNYGEWATIFTHSPPNFTQMGMGINEHDGQKNAFKELSRDLEILQKLFLNQLLFLA